MKVIDITGLICNGMWTFGSLFPRPSIVPNSGFCPGFGEYYYTAFEGFHAQVGTYIETPAHFYGLDHCELLSDEDLEEIFTDEEYIVVVIEYGHCIR